MDMITHAVIGGGKAIDFGISSSAEFFDILSRTLYTDQHLAVVREVLCNAWDAHIAAEITDRPIEINIDDGNLIVRDYGPGIHHDQIGPIYGVYGASTKKNDGTQTGGFGLGCKAPFAYTDHFEVVSHHNGTKTIYNMSKSNAVAMGKPGIITIATMPTTESGLRVKIPIQHSDRYRFQELIKRIVSNGEMNAHFNGTKLDTVPFSTFPHGYLLTQHQLVEDHKRSKILLRYGNVVYPISGCPEINSNLTKVAKFVNNFGNYRQEYTLVLQAEPNTISVTPSREALSMQEHTINTLNQLLIAFLDHVKPLDEEMQKQLRELTEQAVVAKDYNSIFSSSWGFSPEKLPNEESLITNLVQMARFKLSQSYPDGVQFRVKDLQYRVEKAAELKVLDKGLVTTFVKELPKVQDKPHRYAGPLRKGRSSDWLQKNVIGKMLTKLHNNGLDNTTLYIIDRADPSYTDYRKEGRILPVRKSYGRNHLANLPYLRKYVVVTTAMTQVNDRLNLYVGNNPGTPDDGMLLYHVRSRKGDAAQEALDFFTKMRYEIIDLTKRQSWEYVAPPAGPRKKPEPYAGLPALTSLRLPSGNISISAFHQQDTHADMLATPELVMVVGQRCADDFAFEDMNVAASKALIALYGHRIGVAKNKIEMKKAIKHGAVDFQPVLEADMLAMLTNSPAIKEYLAYDFNRVKDKLVGKRSQVALLRLIYSNEDMRKEFGLKRNITDAEKAMLTLYQAGAGIRYDCKNTIDNFVETIPLAPENADAVKAVTDNDMLDLLDDRALRFGLQSPKKQIYYDIFLKALKG